MRSRGLRRPNGGLGTTTQAEALEEGPAICLNQGVAGQGPQQTPLRPLGTGRHTASEGGLSWLPAPAGQAVFSCSDLVQPPGGSEHTEEIRTSCPYLCLPQPWPL